MNGFDPDLVVITGDLTASGQPPALVAALQDWMARLKTKTSRYVVNGDSDPDFEALVEKAPGVTYLCDKGLAVDVNGAHLWIGGVDNHRRPPDPNYCMAEAPPGRRAFSSPTIPTASWRRGTGTPRWGSPDTPTEARSIFLALGRS